MASLWRAVFLLFRLLCYTALVVVVLGLGAVILLPMMGVCSSISSAGVTCTSPFSTQIAHFGLSVMLVTVFTGVPALLALAAIFFLLRKVVSRNADPAASRLTEGPATAAAPGPAAASKPGFVMFLAKGFGIMLGVAVLFGVIAGMRGGGG